jgi:hypothetical protein
MAMEKVAALVSRAARDSGFAEALIRDPTQLRAVLELTDAHVAALRSAEALAPRPAVQVTADGQAAQAIALGTGTLYPPEGSGTMALDYVVIPSPAFPPQQPPSAPLPPLAPPPSPPRAAPQPPAPAAAPHAPVPTPQVTPPAPVRTPFPMPMPGRQPTPAPAVPIAPVQPGSPVPTPSPTPTRPHRVPYPSIAPSVVGVAGRGCCDTAVAGIVALVSNTAVPAITAITAIAGLRK